MQYFDKNGVEIKEGMTIRMEDGSLELVYDTTDSYGNPDLGINAYNEEYLELLPLQAVSSIRFATSICDIPRLWTIRPLPKTTSSSQCEVMCSDQNGTRTQKNVS